MLSVTRHRRQYVMTMILFLLSIVLVARSWPITLQVADMTLLLSRTQRLPASPAVRNNEPDLAFHDRFFPGVMPKLLARSVHGGYILWTMWHREHLR